MIDSVLWKWEWDKENVWEIERKKVCVREQEFKIKEETSKICMRKTVRVCVSAETVNLKETESNQGFYVKER